MKRKSLFEELNSISYDNDNKRLVEQKGRTSYCRCDTSEWNS